MQDRTSRTALWLMAAILSVGLAGTANAAETARRTMTVTGSGEVSARPDVAYIDSGVVTEAKTAAEALAANTKAMTALFAGLESMKIAKDDIQTTQFTVNPVYAQPAPRPDGSQPPAVIRGYQVTNQVSVTIRKLDTLGAALDKLVQLGSNQLGGIRFDIDKPEPLMDRARQSAVAEALRKAKLYAAAAGVALGHVVSISESGGYAPQPVFMKAMAMRDSAPVPVAAGMQKVTADVTMLIYIV
ncbi:MAG: SIMPL domain-containing protein [Parvibaculum sp.]|uniref:SIMPL domain-containing protein n=1 Tax=Parvibaculum sp. TaxID=2024848 RepID=UPI00283FA4CB|nr:SIMPL domain-containing protein [Parvibaculum sp.]MDR3499019.1 SIMPL domain-containing protein [Parvibaculum sp.]